MLKTFTRATARFINEFPASMEPHHRLSEAVWRVSEHSWNYTFGKYLTLFRKTDTFNINVTDTAECFYSISSVLCQLVNFSYIYIYIKLPKQLC